MSCSTRWVAAAANHSLRVPARTGWDHERMLMKSVTESAGEKSSMHAPTLELYEIQATVLRPRPAPYFGTHVLLRIDALKPAAGATIPPCAPAHMARSLSSLFWKTSGFLNRPLSFDPR